MKWMWSTAIVFVSVSAIAHAQSADMNKTSKSDMMRTTYTGCVEVVNHGGAFLLTHVGDAAKAAMHGDTTMHDGAEKMEKTDTGKMEREPMAMHDGKMETMAPNVIALTGSSELKKHVGHKVAVTGTVSHGAMGTMRNDLSTLTVSSLKVVAKSCS